MLQLPLLHLPQVGQDPVILVTRPRLQQLLQGGQYTAVANTQQWRRWFYGSLAAAAYTASVVQDARPAGVDALLGPCPAADLYCATRLAACHS
jgi:hypothetical protein